jgi:hypothetical protein
MKLISQELVGLNSRRLGSLLHRRLMQTALLAAVVGAGLSAHAATLTWDHRNPRHSRRRRWKLGLGHARLVQRHH